MQRLILFLLLMGAIDLTTYAQTKYEREYRLNAEDIPVPAREFIEGCGFSKRIKWYGEESLTGHSFEAKVKHFDTRYSIEFDTLGQLEDVEGRMPWKAIPEATRNRITQQLDEAYSRHRFIEIQRQWTGETAVLSQLIRGEPVGEGYTLRYEIVFKGKTADGWRWYEYLFSATGEIERKSPIVFRNTDNLDF